MGSPFSCALDIAPRYHPPEHLCVHLVLYLYSVVLVPYLNIGVGPWSVADTFSATFLAQCVLVHFSSTLCVLTAIFSLCFSADKPCLANVSTPLFVYAFEGAVPTVIAFML